MLQPFLTFVMGGPTTHNPRGIGEAHAHLRLSDADFDSLLEAVEATLRDVGIDYTEVDEVLEGMEVLRSEVVTVSKEEAAKMEARAEMAATLFSRVGGQATVSKAVPIFSARIASDDCIKHMFQGLTTQQSSHGMQEPFLTLVLGGPSSHSRKSLSEVHGGMKLSEIEFDAILDHLAATLREVGTSEYLIEEVLRRVEQWRFDIVSMTAEQVRRAAEQAAVEAADAAALAAPRSLFDRLGGDLVLRAATVDLYDRVVQDPAIMHLFNHADLRRLRLMVRRYLSMCFGASVSCTGIKLRQVHAHLALTVAHLDAWTKHLRDCLEANGAEPADVEEAVGVVKALYPDILPLPKIETQDSSPAVVVAATPTRPPKPSQHRRGSLLRRVGGPELIVNIVPLLQFRLESDPRATALLTRPPRESSETLLPVILGESRCDEDACASDVRSLATLGITSDESLDVVIVHVDATLREIRVKPAHMRMVWHNLLALRAALTNKNLKHGRSQMRLRDTAPVAHLIAASVVSAIADSVADRLLAHEVLKRYALAAVARQTVGSSVRDHLASVRIQALVRRRLYRRQRPQSAVGYGLWGLTTHQVSVCVSATTPLRLQRRLHLVALNLAQTGLRIVEMEPETSLRVTMKAEWPATAQPQPSASMSPAPPAAGSPRRSNPRRTLKRASIARGLSSDQQAAQWPITSLPPTDPNGALTPNFPGTPLRSTAGTPISSTFADIGPGLTREDLCVEDGKPGPASNTEGEAFPRPPTTPSETQLLATAQVQAAAPFSIQLAKPTQPLAFPSPSATHPGPGRKAPQRPAIPRLKGLADGKLDPPACYHSDPRPPCYRYLRRSVGDMHSTGSLAEGSLYLNHFHLPTLEDAMKQAHMLETGGSLPYLPAGSPSRSNMSPRTVRLKPVGGARPKALEEDKDNLLFWRQQWVRVNNSLPHPGRRPWIPVGSP